MQGHCKRMRARHTSHVTRHTSHVTRHTSHVTRHTSRYPSQVCNLLGSLPIDIVPSESNRQVLVHALVEEFPEAAKAMATVTRVCKQQVSEVNLPRDRPCPTDSLRSQPVTIAISAASTKTHTREQRVCFFMFIMTTAPHRHAWAYLFLSCVRI